MTATTDDPHAGPGALAGLSLAILLASLGTSIANVALPTLAQAFDASFQEAQWVVLAYLLASTTLIVSVGRLGDLTGRRRLLIAGIALFTAASALCGIAPTLWTLIAARAAQGLGAAIMLALAMALVSETVPKARTGSAMGLLGTMSAIGTFLGPSLGGLLIAALGWRAIFLVTLPAGVVAGLLVYRHLPVDRRAPTTERAAFDGRGTLLLGLALASYTLAMTVGRGRFGPLNVALLAAAAIAVALFAMAQTRTRSPLIRPALLRSPRLSASLATTTLVSTVMMTTLVVGPFYLTGALDLGAASVGLVMSIGPLVAALTGVPAGRIADRFGAQGTTIIGLAGIATGSLALAAIPTTLGIAAYVAPIIVITASYALFQTANTTNVMTGVVPDERGLTSGMLNLSRNLGLITGASVMGAVFWLAAGTGEITTAAADSVATAMRVTFLVAAALIVAALGIAAAGSGIMRPVRRAVVILLAMLAALPAAASAAERATRPPGSPPLSDRAAAALVQRAAWEPRPSNRDENRRLATPAELRYFRAHSDMPYRGRVTGHFRGTTDEIVQWAALKHGINVNVLRAVAVQESWWRMSTVGDAGDSFGLFQIRRPYHCCPGLARRSTAFNADYYGAILRAFYDGRMTWLNTVERGRDYGPGDLWGSVGAWFAGRWRTPPAEQYIADVKAHLGSRTWRTSAFAGGDG